MLMIIVNGFCCLLLFLLYEALNDLRLFANEFEGCLSGRCESGRNVSYAFGHVANIVGQLRDALGNQNGSIQLLAVASCRASASAAVAMQKVIVWSARKVGVYWNFK